MPSRATVAAIVALVVIVLAAGTASATDACSLLTPSKVSAVLGIIVRTGAHVVPNKTEVCQWSLPGHHSMNDKRVVVTVYTTDGSLSPVDRFNYTMRPMQGITKTKVSGIGDEAAYLTNPGVGTALVVRDRNDAFDVRVYGFSAEQVKEKERMLAADILARL